MKKAWIVLTVASWAVHQVQLTTENDFGCSDQTTLPLTVYPGYQAGLSALPLSGCSPLEVSFEALPGADSYLWEFGDGRMSHETTPTHTYQAPGTYQVQLTATGPGGTSQSSEVQVRVYQNPTALFDVVPKIIYLPGERPVFINRSENASDYLWDMGDGSTYRDFAPNHTYTQPGLYTIGLTAISPEGCEDSYQMHEVLKVEVGGELAFPNAFTPDPSGPSGGRYEFGDPRNTVFYPSTQKGVSEYLLQIYTRWGELVFESKDVEIGWDGYHNKRLAPQGVYIWRVQYKTADGRMNTRAGDVTLIR